ncbi:MAG: penicillin-binding protein 2 [Dehalococcoidia bacterium]
MQLPPANRRRWRARYHEPNSAEVSDHRFLILKILIIALFGVLIAQLARMQLVHQDSYEARAENNRLRRVLVLPARGDIVDRNGEQLVSNVPIFSAGVVPADVPDDQFLAVVHELARITKENPQTIADMIVEAGKSEDPFTPVIVKQDLGDETAFVLRERQADLPGVQVLVESIRAYPTGALTSHLLGYVGRINADEFDALKSQGYQINDRLGKTGVELTYEPALRGTPGYDLVEIDAAGRQIRTLRSVDPRAAGNVVLSVDLDLQRKVQQYLRSAMQSSGSASGTAAVMNVHTGEMLALVSLPAYDNNLLTDPVDEKAYVRMLNDPAKPLVNHGIAEMYAPGSTFKLVTGTAALQEGVATPNTTITSYGSISVGDFVFNDWAPLGTLDFYGGVAMSSDVYFYYLSGGYFQDGQQIFAGLGAKRLARYAREYGLGKPTGIDLPGEAPGLVPDPTWKESTIKEPWYLGDTYHFGIGQGFVAVTPLQLMRVTAAVANGGDVLVPHVVREIDDPNGNAVRQIEPEVANKLPISQENLAVMRDGLRRAADYGTATSGASSYVTIGGKTGTAEFGAPHGDGSYETHAWYTGFAPFDNPEIALVVFLEKGRGAATAGPVASQIFDYYFGRQHFAQDGESAR